jgi:ribosomal protein S18 acetylase RimI-like enzyme
MDARYRIVEADPSVPDYLRLRAESGLSPKGIEQAEGALAGAWLTVRVEDTTDGSVVGMGRVVGDGGWYFQIADMAVLPEHQHRGIGAAVLDHLLDAIGDRAPADPYVTLMADAPGRALYARHGFVDTAPHSIGMVLDPARRPA